MNKRELKSIIESILFVWSEPIHIDEFSKILDVNKKTIRELICEMQDEIDHYRRGIIINNYDDYLQLSTRIDHDEYISKLIKSSKRRISNSSMEVLAIIAYNQPITRIEIDNIRGVKSFSSIETLKTRNLIEEVGKLDTIGKPILYGTTVDFLKSFNLNSLGDLPEIENIHTLEDILDDDNED